jgi:hypothetical protein
MVVKELFTLRPPLFTETWRLLFEKMAKPNRSMFMANQKNYWMILRWNLPQKIRE